MTFYIKKGTLLGEAPKKNRQKEAQVCLELSMENFNSPVIGRLVNLFKNQIV